MTEPVPPVRAILGPIELPNRREMAVALICDEGYPHTAQQQHEVFEDARQIINESLLRRRIPAPVGGWTLGLVPPWEPWQSHVAPDIAARVLDELTEHPATAAVVVVAALDLSGLPRQAP